MRRVREPACTQTAALLARRFGLPARVVLRFCEQGLLAADFATTSSPFRVAANMRTLAQLWRAGWTPARIARSWRHACELVGDPDEALHGLLASLGRDRLTVRAADGRLLERGGQLTFDFAPDRGDAAAVAAARTPAQWFDLGVAAEAAGRLDAAIAAYERALAGDSSAAHYNLGNCYYAARRRREARAQFEAVVAIDPEHVDGWNNLGVVRGRSGDHAGAIAALQRAVALAPHYADAHYNLAETLAAVGDLAGARQHWQSYLTYDPNSRWADRVRRRLRVRAARPG